MKRLNVLYLIRTRALGGSHTIIRLLLQHLPREQFNIITVPYDAPRVGDKDFIESVRRQGDDVAPERIPWKGRTNWFKARKVLDELIRGYAVDLIHTHDTNSNVLVGLGRNRWPCACIGSPYGWWQPRWRLRARMYHWVEKHLALPCFDRIYTVSEDMKTKILEGNTPEERIRVIHTGLDLAAFEGGEQRQVVRAHFSFADDHIVIGTVSRLFKEKGHTYLLDAVRQLAKEFPGVRVLIVGVGDERSALEQQAMRLGIRDKVIFAEFYRDLPGVLRAMDLFAQPSIMEEGFPTAALEAQVMGLPVIASDIGSTHETVRDGETGMLVPPANAVALAGALRELITNKARRKAMAAAARPWIERSFTLDNMIGQMTKTYWEAYESYRDSTPGANPGETRT